MGRCGLPEIKNESPSLGYLDEMGDDKCRRTWLWWAATSMRLKIAATNWTPRTRGALHQRAQDLLEDQVYVKGTASEKAAWITLLGASDQPKRWP